MSGNAPKPLTAWVAEWRRLGRRHSTTAGMIIAGAILVGVVAPISRVVALAIFAGAVIFAGLFACTATYNLGRIHAVTEFKPVGRLEEENHHDDR